VGSAAFNKIIFHQGGRCLYCHVRFTGDTPATRDHILPESIGGANFGINIFAACRSCNSQRCDIPFRTYCKLLSPTQNRRILRHLVNRLLADDFEGEREDGGLSSFLGGLAEHHPQHWRYLDIQERSPVRKRYAAKNRLLPRNPVLILKAALLGATA
jgi:hypothetical protein